ncbi:hypothetical protein RSAG8_07618, partial [Rhizoctonia solani AG-8 WAC10335]
MAPGRSLNVKEIAAVVSVAAGVAYSLKVLADSSKGPLPPGPKSLPLIGHILSVPQNFEHVAYAKMGKGLDSEIIALTATGQIIVLLNSAEATSELLDKRSSIYSGRAQIPAVSDEDMMDWGQGIVFLNKSDRWRRDRRMLHEALHRGVVPRYHPAQEKQIQALVGRLLNTPSTLDAFIQELLHSEPPYCILPMDIFQLHPTIIGLKWLALQLITLLKQPSLLVCAEKFHPSMQMLADTRRLAEFIVNFIPTLKYLPDWFPGMGWKLSLRNWREHKEHTTAAPYNWTKDQIRNGTAAPSIAQNLLSAFPDYTPDTEDDVHIKLMSATMFGAMVLYLEVALKIQEAADRVLGAAERFPTIHDQEQMPYVRSTLLELLRWQLVNPLAIPHAAMEEDEYKGYHIPKGSIVAITRDESIYPDPGRFNPDRFLDPEVPPAPAFGYGRRICPGSHFADANLFPLISTLMYIFDIQRAVDANGQEIITEIKMMIDSTVSWKPQSFPFVLKPRSKAHMKLDMDFNA